MGVRYPQSTYSSLWAGTFSDSPRSPNTIVCGENRSGWLRSAESLGLGNGHGKPHGKLQSWQHVDGHSHCSHDRHDTETASS